MRGLLGRHSLAAGEGMLLQPAPSIHTAFMRFAIDAVFMDGTLRVMKVVEELRPWRAASAHRGRAVLELAAGESTVRGVKVGDQLGVIRVTDQVGAFTSTSVWREGSASGDSLSPSDETLYSAPESPNGSRNGKAEPEPSSDPQRSAKTHVLVVGPDRRFRSVAAALLTRRGYAVTLADRTSNIADLAKREAADVVLLDVGSSLTDGAHAAAQIEALDPLVGMVVVADEAEPTLSAMPVRAKWDSFEELFTSIERARRDRLLRS
jgi:uncharacterized membrane protein (UPF0127 family)/CheY-like chemotaxis protein